MKRGTEDLDFFIGDEALAATAGPGTWELAFSMRKPTKISRLWTTLSNSTWANRELGS